MGLKMWLPETEKVITPIPCMTDKDKSKELKHCTWLEKDIPSSECFDWCFKADRTPSTCEHFKAWWREIWKNSLLRQEFSNANDKNSFI